MRLYTDLAAWWPVISPPAEYADEAALYLGLLEALAGAAPRSVLELGSGGGHLACHVPADVELVLVDRAPAMLAASRRLNPTRTHVEGDLRTLRLGRTFDAVILHDAVMYMLTEADLAAALATCFAHLRPGGVAAVLPDLVAEDFAERTLSGGGTAPDGRTAQVFEWHWDPDLTDTTFQVEFAFLLRDADGVRCVHESHTHGLFDRPTWARLVEEAGFALHWAELPEELALGECFLLHKPA